MEEKNVEMILNNLNTNINEKATDSNDEIVEIRNTGSIYKTIEDFQTPEFEMMDKYERRRLGIYERVCAYNHKHK